MREDCWRAGSWAGNGLGSAGDVSGTLGGGSVGTGISHTLGSDVGGEQETELAQQRNVSERVANAAAWYNWMVANGVAGSGFCKACTRYCADTMEASADEVVGIAKEWRGNSTVRVMRSLQVRDTKMW